MTRSGGGGTETRSWGGPSAVPLADARTLIHSRRSTTPATAALALASQPAASLQPRATPTLLRPEPTTSSPYGRDMSCSFIRTFPSCLGNLRPVLYHSVVSLLFSLLLFGPSLFKELRCNKRR